MRVDVPLRSELPVEVADKLMPEHVEVDPVGGAAALGATEHPGIEAPRLLEIADLDGDVKGGEDGAAHLREDNRGIPAPPVRPCTGGRRVLRPGRRVSAPLTSLRRRSLRAPAVKSRKNDLEDVEGEPSRRLRLQDAAQRALTVWPSLGSVRPPFEPSDHSASFRFRGR